MADDLAAVIDGLSLQDAALVGFSMGGGEIARYMSRHQGKGVRKAALVSSVVPYLLKTADNPDGADASVFEGMKAGIDRGPARVPEGLLQELLRPGPAVGRQRGRARTGRCTMALLASPKATLDCVDAFGTTDFRPDLAAFDVPTLVIHGTADQTVPIDPTGRAAAKGIAGATLKEYDGAPARAARDPRRAGDAGPARLPLSLRAPRPGSWR